MIEDADTLPSEHRLVADLCIIGAGAAGLAMAWALRDAPLHVLLLEAGGMRPDAWADSLSQGELAPGSRHPAPHLFRRRRLGGTLSVWGGRSAPFTAQELGPRPWLSLQGWPIGTTDLAPWWHAAHALLDLGRFDYSANTALTDGMRRMFPEAPDRMTDLRTDTIERFSRPTDFATKYRRECARHPRHTILLHAAACELRLTGSHNAIRELRGRTRRGTSFAVTARAFALAAGGLETPRLLLASNTQEPYGVGNADGQVGRSYMCHLAGVTGSFQTTTSVPFRGYERDADGVYCRRRLTLTDAAQERAGIGSVVARLHHPAPADPSHRSGALSLAYLGARLLPPEYRLRVRDGTSPNLAPHLVNIATDPAGATRLALLMLKDRIAARRKFPSLIANPRSSALTLDVHAEQMPNPQSRVLLARETDATGVPRLIVDWRYCRADIETIRTTLRLMRAGLAQAGHGTLTIDEDAVADDMLRHGAYGGHHLGTTRMSTHPAQGVVDPDCRVHGIANLFIASGAVFPTSGSANPTLTIVALALRLAHHLGQVLTQAETAAPSPPAAILAPRPFSSAGSHVN